MPGIAKFEEKIRSAINQKDGEFGNGILYKMCLENPYHNEPDVVSGKIWLIGRAYSAAIERVRSKKKINDDFYKEEVGPTLRDGILDERLKNLGSIRKIDKENLRQILSTHKYLQSKIHGITGLNKRSLCSKYLHFHLPELFFIYDSRVDGTLRKIYPRWKDFNNTLIDDVDKPYAIFFCKALALKNEVEERMKLEITPRHVDNFLINEANELIKQSRTGKK
ncbi:MAG: hypothetical protein COV10_00705 [Candidatus Vogelbacteria bacterium CG10_big_fil_rev_8_21_14_0_10_51_16]|uniref:Uncharacterized protein n=1 Tax=Candidatus Vogelbacteria bacterium CG10_big_fil_rev_8_21_14_0_10_51_16 TaxID=1975045 RepID=A0A2H0RF45_9BACT|nr:MAG: hypothetical protein COV10_00705 [Candidatus Vogelbacteria bacterium CG10_big_fil_rev_8_21_14_0_10_51_16]